MSPTSCFCFSLCHHNNSDSFLFTNQRFKKEMIGKYQNIFRPTISSVAVVVITAIFSMIASVESTNRAFLKVFILIHTI
jgi:hypothetical protein